jgi:hypothetical protein
VWLRLSELASARSAALCALALASSAAGAFAQDVPMGALGLRGDNETAAIALEAAVEANPVAPAPGDAGPTTENKPPRKAPGKPKLLLGVYPGAQRLGLRGGAPELAPGQTPPPTIAALPPAPRRKPKPDEKPFDPVGVAVGDLKLLPYVEEDAGWASNPGSISGSQKGSPFATTEAGLALQSDWGSSDLHGALKAGYTDYFAASEDDAPYANGVLDGRLDVTRDLSFDAEGRLSIADQTLASLGLAGSAAVASTAHPLVETYGATGGGAQKLGDLTLALHGSLDHTSYENATIDGVVDDLSSDDYSDLGLRARASYEASRAISPFVELDVDTRRYDDGVDAAGYARNSNGVTGLAGATLGFTQQLTGETSLGYGERAYQDPRLPEMSSPLVNASLIWTATPLTTVTAKAQTTLAETITPGASGAIQHNYTIDVAHDLTRSLTLGASAGYSTDDYVGVALHDATATLGARAEYHLSRDVILKASATRQDYVSSAPNSNYIANVFLLGLRVQR